MSTRLSAVMIKNYAGHKYAPGRVVILVSVVLPHLLAVVLVLGVLVSALLLVLPSVASPFALPFVVLVCSSRWCLLCIVLAFIVMLVWRLSCVVLVRRLSCCYPSWRGCGVCPAGIRRGLSWCSSCGCGIHHAGVRARHSSCGCGAKGTRTLP